MKPLIKIIAAALSGGFLVLAFSRPDLAILAPVALVVFLAICYSCRPRQAFLYGWVSGAVFFAGVCYWVGIYGIVPLLIMAIVLGLSFAASFAGIAISVRGVPWWGRILAVPAVWTAVEIIRSETGAYSFSYGVIGYAFHGFGPALGLASVVGVYGVSFAVLAVSAGILEAVIAIRKNDTRRAAIMAVVTLAAAVVPATAGAVLNARQGVDSGPLTRVSLVQASIPQNQKWLSSKSGEIMDKYEALAIKAGRSKPGLIVLPEAALPAYVRYDDELVVRLQSWAKKAGYPVLAGVPLLDNGGAYNTAILFNKRGIRLDSYEKITPVLFGEVIPFRRFSEMIYPDFKQMGDIKTGARQTIFRLPGAGGLSFGTLICSESMYLRLAIRLAARNPDAIVVITNDGWFYSSNEAELHFAMTRFRSAETGKYIAQAANTGISAIISPAGKVEGKIGLNKSGVSTAMIRSRRDTTSFTAWGWLFTYLMIAIIAVAALVSGLVNVCTKPQYASII